MSCAISYSRIFHAYEQSYCLVSDSCSPNELMMWLLVIFVGYLPLLLKSKLSVLLGHSSSLSIQLSLWISFDKSRYQHWSHFFDGTTPIPRTRLVCSGVPRANVSLSFSLLGLKLPLDTAFNATLSLSVASLMVSVVTNDASSMFNVPPWA